MTWKWEAVKIEKDDGGVDSEAMEYVDSLTEEGYEPFAASDGRWGAHIWLRFWAGDPVNLPDLPTSTYTPGTTPMDDIVGGKKTGPSPFGGKAKGEIKAMEAAEQTALEKGKV